MTSEINIENIDSYIQENDGVILYFYSEQCSACKPLREKVQLWIREDFPKLKFVLINAREYPEVTAHYNIYSNPTILGFIGGKEVMRESSFLSKVVFSEKIRKPYQLLLG